MSKKSFSITLHGSGPELHKSLSLELRWSFDEEWLEFFKAKIPYRERWFDDSSKIWWVDPKHLEKFKKHMPSSSFDYVVLIDGNATTDLKTGQVIIQESLF